MKTCTRCVYDESVPGITFDRRGVCNFCHQHDIYDREYPPGSEGMARLHLIANEIRHRQRKREFDVVVGVSGGCDSSYLLHMTKEVLHLRPLAVHFDNSWNMPIANDNLKKMLDKLDVPLQSYAVDPEEYDELYKAFLRAGVPDLEAPSDIGLAAVLFDACAKNGIRDQFIGHSFRTEGVSPLSWLYMDGQYIKDVFKQHGHGRLDTYPNMTFLKQLWWMGVKGIRQWRPFWWHDHHKETTKALLTGLYDWQWYGGHHCENRITEFYHSYFMPIRWSIDQRKNGYAALVRSGQMSRTEAQFLLSRPADCNPDTMAMVINRLCDGSKDVFDHYMTQEKRAYTDYRNYRKLFQRTAPLWKLLAAVNRAPRSFVDKYCAKEN